MLRTLAVFNDRFLRELAMPLGRLGAAGDPR
jgi:hypothetical protein